MNTDRESRPEIARKPRTPEEQNSRGEMNTEAVKTARDNSAAPQTAGDGQRRAWMVRLTRHIPPGQFGRYLLVGIGNTLFGYGTFALLTALLDRITPHGYVLASLLASVLSITVAYLNYKWLVFKTQGNYLREWARCVAVYSGGIIISAALLPLVVFVIRRGTGMQAAAPYLAGALLIGFNAVYSFLGHKKFSFRSPQ